ncbi:MAG: DUF4416 family protein [Deltaproteobacteria bacterium]|nr:DUF4416 family protein [Deltaproteobacteria bacterium]MBW1932750.1 DUF4416 family protein [Deltaproteobacteria bacterium]MBW1938827.1 DUF4416 family protein [Deltaproteobacteria bacterium]MBW1965058.1 DUF4416 family protein [Deltaproteobacteria bacterium]MBW2080638.1 DUF4416 family protein [Deltaproteobacteria bacterium]
MSILRTPPPAKLVCSIFSQRKGLINRVADALCSVYGTADFKSPVIPFDCTSYYEKEFGRGLKRIFISFTELVFQDDLVDIKHATNKLEQEFSTEGKRRVNIDPGILTAERLVLATCKNFPHRIYLGREVFANLTFIYRKNSFIPLPWTYPDYSPKEVIELWNNVRKSYLKVLSYRQC